MMRILPETELQILCIVIINDRYDFPFSTHRKIIVAEKKRLEITLDFRQYSINPSINLSFPVPKNYERN